MWTSNENIFLDIESPNVQDAFQPIATWPHLLAGWQRDVLLDTFFFSVEQQIRSWSVCNSKCFTDTRERMCLLMLDHKIYQHYFQSSTTSHVQRKLWWRTESKAITILLLFFGVGPLLNSTINNATLRNSLKIPRPGTCVHVYMHTCMCICNYVCAM